MLESRLEGEITDHVGCESTTGRGSGNSRNGSRAETRLTDVGPVEVKVPGDAAGTFEPQIVRNSRLTGRRLDKVRFVLVALLARVGRPGRQRRRLGSACGCRRLSGRMREGISAWRTTPTTRWCSPSPGRVSVS
ncbi:transposase [Actinomadura rugatobispora]|uniref:Transposase n=1 Tax=Actinomadura rugatobispora TaxID=1994 RepID=A0ABW0ZQR2_9ACTN|nr:hypothetical protein GCM10010200_096010 [Actinomadura rugatobispora]